MGEMKILVNKPPAKRFQQSHSERTVTQLVKLWKLSFAFDDNVIYSRNSYFIYVFISNEFPPNTVLNNIFMIHSFSGVLLSLFL